MFATTLECGIRKVAVKVKDVDGRIVRRCRVTLAHEFTAAIAKELGKDAIAVRSALKSGAVEKAVIPIDSLAALGAFAALGEKVKVERLTGVKAVALAPKNDDEGATIQLEFEFLWDPAAWAFLGKHCSTVAEVVLTKRQLTLAEVGGNN
jgi:hypothetical protein